jgi:hypothetical protein
LPADRATMSQPLTSRAFDGESGVGSRCRTSSDFGPILPDVPDFGTAPEERAIRRALHREVVHWPGTFSKPEGNVSKMDTFSLTSVIGHAFDKGKIGQVRESSNVLIDVVVTEVCPQAWSWTGSEPQAPRGADSS